MNTFIPETSGPGRRVSVWADRRFLFPDSTIEPGCIFFHRQSVGSDHRARRRWRSSLRLRNLDRLSQDNRGQVKQTEARTPPTVNPTNCRWNKMRPDSIVGSGNKKKKKLDDTPTPKPDVPDPRF